MAIFDEKEIVAGDLVKVELDLEVFKMMHDAAGLWSGDMTEVIISLAIVYMTACVYVSALTVSIASRRYNWREPEQAPHRR